MIRALSCNVLYYNDLAGHSTIFSLQFDPQNDNKVSIKLRKSKDFEYNFVNWTIDMML